MNRQQQTPPPPPLPGQPNQPRQPMPLAGYSPKKSRGKLIAAIIGIVAVIAIIFVALLLISGGDIANILDMDNELTGKEKAKEIVQEFYNAYESKDWDTYYSYAMNSDGTFLSDTLTKSQINENISNMNKYSQGFTYDLDFEVVSVKKLDYNAENTKEIYGVKMKGKMTRTNITTGEKDEQGESESVVFVAKNKDDKWGLRMNSYDLIFDEDQYEPDDSYDKATTISVGSTQTHNFHDEENGDQDWYKFTLNSQSNVKIVIPTDEYYRSYPDIELYDDTIGDSYSIYNANIASSWDYDEEDDDIQAKIEDILDAGTYYIKIESWDTTPKYEISLTVN